MTMSADDTRDTVLAQQAQSTLPIHYIFEKRQGRSPALNAGEDEDMYQRLLAAGARGMYVPELIIYHFVPTERLTKRYHRAWCFWQSVSSAVLDRIRPQPTAYVLGVARYFYGRALRGMFRLVSIWKPGPADRFSKELALWELAGFFYGKHFYRPE